MLVSSQGLTAFQAEPPDKSCEALEPRRECAKTVLIVETDIRDDRLDYSLADLGYAIARTKADRLSADDAAAGCLAAILCAQDSAHLQPVADLSAHCPVIVIGADQSFDFALAAARSGASAVLNHHIDMIELAAWLEVFAEPPGRAPFIMIVDDDELLTETYAMTLEEAGMRTLIVTDPRLVTKQIAETSPDLVLMDLNMPHVGGIELAQVLRQSRRYLSLPIVFWSSESDVSRQNKARRLGGDDFIAKSTDTGQLVSLVRMRAERAIELRSVMERDSLTGLYNHARTIDRLQMETDRCRRTGAQVSVAIIDLDNFKTVNDRFGHQAGDLVIQNLARTLVGGLRRIDIVGRCGGEEFAVILLDTPLDAARTVIEKLRVKFSEMEFDTGKTPFSVTFSAGIAGSVGGADADTLIARADKAVYEAKRLGRDRICVS